MRLEFRSTRLGPLVGPLELVLIFLQRDCAVEQSWPTNKQKNTFSIPGLGKLVLVNRPGREMQMQFGPNKGQTIRIPSKRVIKFRVAKAAKDAILGSK